MTSKFQQTRGRCLGLCWGLSVGCDRCALPEPPAPGICHLGPKAGLPLCPWCLWRSLRLFCQPPAGPNMLRSPRHGAVSLRCLFFNCYSIISTQSKT